MANKIFKGDTGTDIILDAGEDLTSQTELKIKYKKPSGTTGEWVATVQNSTEAVYTTQAGDLDESGTWRLKIYVVLPNWSGHGEPVDMEIYPDW